MFCASTNSYVMMHMHKWWLTSDCIDRKESSHVHIKPHTITRAMTFGKGLPESEVVY